ncbi:MAG: N-acetylglucosamine-6-phosphate deacetylase [Verrucomicrobia bacterium]|jgi:N-acetylglucosamine-6-phosphate deacetylase|nr:N-acetylglucosamine-6-phosphate deacetylase [Verrucomicrobiota bacterium]MDA7645479.1 N-acetylglucosamine-6-phosphate deacetylase [bacterium]
MIVFHNGRIILEDTLLDDSAVVVSEGKIVDIVSAGEISLGNVDDQIDLAGGYLSPGYVDLHVHGGRGADYMDGTAESVMAANRAHARHGTTTIFPTTTTGSRAQLERMLHSCLSVQEQWSVVDGARIAGVHYYGPYFAADKVGCHSVEGRRDPVAEEYQAAFDLGIIKIATCAAELPGADAFYREARSRGCLVTCGHSNASFLEMQSAFDGGMRHVDHFWCAMSSVSTIRQRLGAPFQGSMEQFVLMNREMSTEVISDGQHLAPDLLEFAYRMIGPKRLCLVTDANRALDMPPGKYRFGSQEDGAWFESDGKVGFVADGSLASSVVGMEQLVRVMARDTSASIPEVVRMASLTPASRVGIDDRVGSVAKGKRADLLVLDPDLQVQRTFVQGEEFIPLSL